MCLIKRQPFATKTGVTIVIFFFFHTIDFRYPIVVLLNYDIMFVSLPLKIFTLLRVLSLLLTELVTLV